jgi:hypothetical protein
LQISGATSSSPLEPNGSAKTAAFSMIHAAAITGDKNGLSKAESPCQHSVFKRFFIFTVNFFLALQ